MNTPKKSSKRLPRALLAIAIIVSALCAALFVVAAYLYNNDPMMLKLCIGRARLLTEEHSAIVTANGKSVAGARCFRIASNRHNGQPCDGFAIVMPGAGGAIGKVFIVYRDSLDAGEPNCSDNDYRFFGNDRLLQSDSGDGIISFNDGKSYGFDPRVVGGPHSASFSIPPGHPILPGARISVANLSS